MLPRLSGVLILIVALAAGCGGSSNKAEDTTNAADLSMDTGALDSASDSQKLEPDTTGDVTLPGDLEQPADLIEITDLNGAEDVIDPEDTCSCGDRVCGVDECGNPCGQCQEPEVCEDGLCLPPVEIECTNEGFEPVVENLALDATSPEMPILVYQAINSEELPYDAVVIENYQGEPYNGPTEPGTYDLEGSNYEDCGLCLRAYRDCGEGGCDRQFLADHGQVEITAIGGAGEKLVAIFHDVVFTEVTINSSTYHSTPVPGGETWCLDGYSIDQEIVLDEASPECVPEGSGGLIGDNVANFSLQNCDGEWVNLHDMCGSKAVLMVAIAGWCSACADWVPQIQAAYDDLHDDGLEVMFILGENMSGTQPNLAFCSSYAASHNLNSSLVFIDHDGEFAWATLFSNVYPYVGDTIGLPWNAVLRGTNMEYVWADTAAGGMDLNDILNLLLQ